MWWRYVYYGVYNIGYGNREDSFLVKMFYYVILFLFVLIQGSGIVDKFWFQGEYDSGVILGIDFYLFLNVQGFLDEEVKLGLNCMEMVLCQE